MDHAISLRLTNSRPTPLTLVVEPWGEEHSLAPGQKVELVASAPQPGSLELEWREQQVAVFGWGGCRIQVTTLE